MPFYKIRDWDEHFEKDRTKQWKTLQWVPIPNKQGSGYRKIMKLPNEKGLKIFACWIALVQVASTCTPRGDLSKYSIDELSDLTMVNSKILADSICFLSQVLDWIEVIENLDVNVKNLDTHGKPNCDSSSILFNSIQSNSIQFNSGKGGAGEKEIFVPPIFDEVKKYCDDNGFGNIAERAFKYYSDADPPWTDTNGKKLRSWKSKFQAVWFREENKNGSSSNGTNFGNNKPNNGNRPRRAVSESDQREIDAGLLTLDGV